MGGNMIKTSELVNRIFSFCEALTGRTLFPYQSQASKRLIRSLLEDDGAEITLLMARQMGKCFGAGTEVLMFDGSIKKVEDIVIGDKVMTPESKPAEVIETHSGFDSLYKVVDTESGAYYIVNGEHLLTLRDKNWNKKVISVNEYNKLSKQEKEKWFGIRVSVDFEEKMTGIAPWEMAGALNKIALKPDVRNYVINSREFREAFLIGVMEHNRNYYYDACNDLIELTFTNNYVVDIVLFVLKSLGFKTAIRKEKKSTVVSFKGNYKELSHRKHYSNNGIDNSRYLYPIKIRKVKANTYYGFEIDSEDHEFLLSDFTVVHNSEVVAATVCGCAIIIPILANMPMFQNDRRFDKYRNRDFMCSIYAPSQTQSQIIFSRIKGFVTSPSAVEVFNDPEISVKFGTFNGEQIVLYLQNLGVSAKIDCRTASDNSNVEGNSCMLMICDEAQDIGTFKYEKSLSPMCSHYNGTRVLIGTPTTQKGFFYDRIEFNKKQAEETGSRDHFEYDFRIGCKYNPQYEKYVTKEMKKNGYESDTFRMAYRLHWIFERGMFVTDEFKKPPYALENEERQYTCSQDVIVGIDVGKKQDSTVVTIGVPDYSKPVIVEKSDKPDVPDFVMYDVKIINWLELLGDNYNEQYVKILEFLGNYKVRACVIDSTGVGTALYDWLNAAVSFPVVPYTFTVKSKSDLAKNLDSYIKNKCIHYVAGEQTANSKEFEHFIEQFLGAEKNFRGQDMMVAHPEVRNAHDDFLYSAALMCWGVNQVESIPTTQDNNIYRGSSTTNVNFKSSMKYLAKRR